MEKKQTAVDLIQQALIKFIDSMDFKDGKYVVTESKIDELELSIKQAKQMEREEIEMCGNICHIIDDVDFDGNVTFMYNGGSDYFTKTYGDNVNPDLQKP